MKNDRTTYAGGFSDVLNFLPAVGILALFPALVMLAANGGAGWTGVLAERALFLIVFLFLGAIGPRRCRRVLMAGMTTALILWDAADLFCFLRMRTQFQFLFLPLVWTTNTNECGGFFRACLPYFSNLLLLYPVIVLAAWHCRRRHRLVLSAAAVAAGLTVAGCLLLPPAVCGRTLTVCERVDSALNEIAEAGLAKELLTLAKTRLDVIAKAPETTLVAVIGESHSRAHSGLYGYLRDTNPELRKRAAAGELFVFRDVVAPHSFTMCSVEKLLTLAAHDRRESFLELPNIFDLAKQAGFRTFWLCNQPQISDVKMPYSAVTGRADIVRHTSPGDRQLPDEALLPAFREALADPAPRTLIVVQLIGSHHHYETTYPADAAHFPPDEAPAVFNPEQQRHRREINAYDNSVRYNDRVLDRMIGMLAETGRRGALVYLADHGENLWEQPGLMLHMEFVPTLQTVEIPMYLYLTPDHPAKARAAAALGRPFASEDLPWLLLDLGELEFRPKETAAKSPLSPAFRAKKRIVSRSGIDYTDLRKAGRGDRVTP